MDIRLLHIDLTDYLNPAGEENVLAVEVKNEGKNSRWYSGSGIYRNVKLIKTNPVHVDLWGVFVNTPAVTNEKATVAVDVKLVNETDEEKDFTLKMKFLNPAGEEVTHFSDDKELSAASDQTFEQTFEISDDQLWSVRKSTACIN